MRRNGVLLWAAVWCFTQAVYAAEGLIASGWLNCDYFAEGAVARTRTNHFIVKVRKCSYSILLDAGNWQDRTISVECIFDGANNYLVKQFSTNPVTTVTEFGADGTPRERELKDPVKPKNDADVLVGVGSIPPPANIPITCVWLALASGCHYQAIREPGLKEPPLAFLGVAYRRFNIQLPAKFALDNGFLTWREDYHPNASYSLEDDKLVERPLLSHALNHYTNSAFRVEKFMDWGGSRIPQTFSFVVIAPDTASRALVMRIRCKGSVDKVSASPESFLPSVFRFLKATVHDDRPGVRGPDGPANYFVQDGQIPALGGVAAKLRERTPKDQIQKITYWSPRGRTLAVVAMCTTTFLFAYIFLRRCRNRS